MKHPTNDKARKTDAILVQAGQHRETDPLFQLPAFLLWPSSASGSGSFLCRLFDHIPNDGLSPAALPLFQLTHGTVPPAFLFRRSTFLQWLCAPEQILAPLDVLPDHHATLVTMTLTVFHSPYISYIMYLLYIK